MPVKPRTRRFTPAALLSAALVVVVVAGLLARSILVDRDDEERDPTVVAVCRVAALGRAGKAAEAHRVFTNDVHGPLHTLAQEATDNGDRAAAARMLEAKELIESADGPTAAQADALEKATVAAADAAGRPAAGCT